MSQAVVFRTSRQVTKSSYFVGVYSDLGEGVTHRKSTCTTINDRPTTQPQKHQIRYMQFTYPDGNRDIDVYSGTLVLATNFATEYDS